MLNTALETGHPLAPLPSRKRRGASSLLDVSLPLEGEVMRDVRSTIFAIGNEVCPSVSGKISRRMWRWPDHGRSSSRSTTSSLRCDAGLKGDTFEKYLGRRLRRCVGRTEASNYRRRVSRIGIPAEYVTRIQDVLKAQYDLHP